MDASYRGPGCRAHPRDIRCLGGPRAWRASGVKQNRRPWPGPLPMRWEALAPGRPPTNPLGLAPGPLRRSAKASGPSLRLAIPSGPTSSPKCGRLAASPPSSFCGPAVKAFRSAASSGCGLSGRRCRCPFLLLTASDGVGTATGARARGPKTGARRPAPRCCASGQEGRPFFIPSFAIGPDLHDARAHRLRRDTVVAR